MTDTVRPPTPAAAAAAVVRRRRPAPPSRTEYEGLVTRGTAFALDAAAINVAAVIVGAAIGVSVSVLSLPSDVDNALIAIGGVAYVVWTILYFVTFWSTTGQTPGDRLMAIRVCRADDRATLHPARATLRLGALVLAAIPLFAGFLPILFDDRRRGIHDMIAGTVVVSAPALGEAPPA
jgi:uncharacterized RDD family membrane protein YckC